MKTKKGADVRGIKKGDFVQIENARGAVRSGEVISVSYWPGDGWQIELTGPLGYSHWKQWIDGGSIIRHEARAQ